MANMKKAIILMLLFSLSIFSGHSQEVKTEEIPLAPQQNRRPENFKPFKYKYSLTDLKNNFSEKEMQSASKRLAHVNEINNKGKWKPTANSIDAHETPEWFKDAKFGMFIDWGLWSIAGWAPKKKNQAMYPDWYEFRMDTDTSFIKYHEKNWGKDFNRDDFIPLFTADKYQPEQLVNIAKEAGMKYIIPFAKHHGGFCLWPSSFTQRDAGDMGPKRDLIEPLVESCKRNGLKFGFYFSIEEWEYPVIGADGELQDRIWGGEIKPYTKNMERNNSGKIPVKNFSSDYLIPQATEFIDQYDPDIIWFDGDWSTSALDIGTYVITSYFYNKAAGRKKVAVNDRFGTENGKWLRSKRGDFFTNEYGDMEKDAKQTNHAWEECRGISQSFGYNWQDNADNVISSKKFIDMFVDIVAHGGNLLLIVNLGGKGALPQIEKERLKSIGKWLNVNGEGIYSTRPWDIQKDGDNYFTRSKDKKYLYVICLTWPGKKLIVKNCSPITGSKITMLGVKDNLNWEKTGNDVVIDIPSQLQALNNRPCKYAWIVKMVIKK